MRLLGKSNGEEAGGTLVGESSCGPTGQDVGGGGKPWGSIKHGMTESDLCSTRSRHQLLLESGPQGSEWTEGLGAGDRFRENCWRTAGHGWDSKGSRRDEEQWRDQGAFWKEHSGIPRAPWWSIGAHRVYRGWGTPSELSQTLSSSSPSNLWLHEGLQGQGGEWGEDHGCFTFAPPPFLGFSWGCGMSARTLFSDCLLWVG